MRMAVAMRVETREEAEVLAVRGCTAKEKVVYFCEDLVIHVRITQHTQLELSPDNQPTRLKPTSASEKIRFLKDGLVFFLCLI